MYLDEQNLGGRQLGLDVAGLIHYPDDTVVYGEIPFGSVLSPLELLRRREEYEVLRNREALGLCFGLCTRRSLPRFTEGIMLSFFSCPAVHPLHDAQAV
jgi:hypothetical protein